MKRKILAIIMALILGVILAVPTFAANQALEDRKIGFTLQLLKKDQDTPDLLIEDSNVTSPITIGIGVSFNDLNGDTGNIGIGTNAARNRAMNDSMGKADLYALVNPLHVGIAGAIRI